MLFEAGLEVMILNLELLALFGFKAFFYDRKRKRFIRLDRDHKLKIILTSGTVATLVINGIHTMAFSKGLTSTKKAFIGTFVLGFWTAYLVTMPVLIGCQRYVDLLNMMRFFESGYFKQIGCPSKGVRWWTGRVQLCNLAATVVSFVAPVAGFTIMGYEAKIPTFLGSTSINIESSLTHWIVFAVSFVLQSYIWCIVPVSFCIMVGSICCVTSVSMAGYLSCLKKSTKLLNNLPISVTLYKQLCVLVGQMNLCFRQMVLPAILIYSISVNILGTYLCVKLNGQLFENVGNVLFPLLAFETFLLIMGFGTTAGFTNKTSIRIVGKMKMALLKKNLENQSYIRRMINACGPMRIRFGSNFIEMSTPLVMTCFCVKSLVRLLLVF
ncbi:hypothetical protein Fcan01_15544 [Folsomia candida]|uniref:Uncharacterized protein n=1 Tax=Folsomia candida TaxID=158441 RepID=A0A226DYE9_FOLCA|nr:hypothetical protein Fcan01_15544 [Folsomia candida]